MTQRRIALVTSIFPVPWDRTRGWPVYETARALSQIADVEVLFTTASYPRSNWLRPRGYLYQDLPVGYSLPGVSMQYFEYPALPMVSRPLNGYVCGRFVTPRLRRHTPDLVLAYWIYPEGYGALRAARTLGVPCVLGARGSDIRVRDAVSRHFTGVALRGADRVLTVSEELRVQALERYGARPERVHTVINGCNTTTFHLRDRAATRQRLGIAGDYPMICFVGRFVEAKGLRELASAFAQLAAEQPELRMALIGDGVFRSQLDALLAGQRVAGRVHLPGSIAPIEVADWVSASDVMTLPSYSEGYPNVLVEALACGVPVVATDVGGTREIVDAGNGLLVPPRDATALTDALRSALSRTWSRAALSARFSRGWDDVARQTLEVCEAAIEDRRR